MTDSDRVAPAPDAKSSGEKIRKGVLFGVLAIMIFALIYDYQIARPSVDAAYDKLLAENQRVNKIPETFLSATDVQKVLNKQPARTFTEGSDFIEVYSFAGGIPGRPHSLFAVYKAHGADKLFYRQAKFIYETGADVAPIPVNTYVEGDEEAYMEELRREMELDHARFAVESRPTFAERDLDGDGQLTGDEISERMSEHLGDIDTDGDGAVSAAEMEVRVQARRAEMASGGGGRSTGPSTRFNEWDVDGDGKLSGDEIPAPMAQRLAEFDTDGDEIVSREEADATFAAMRSGRPKESEGSSAAPSRPPLEQ